MKLRFATVFLFQLLLMSVFVPKIQAWWLVDQFGQLIKMDSSGQVLGDEDKAPKKEDKNEIKSGVKAETTNTNFSTNPKGNIELKSGENKREFENKRIKIKMEQKNGELKIKTKSELTGEEIEIETRMENKERPEKTEPRESRESKESEESVEVQETQEQPENETEIMRIREREEKNEVKINTRNGDFVIDRNNVGATTNFPLSVDSSTNILTVTTPLGEKQVTVLPDQAVQNMLSRNVIDQISGQDSTSSSSRVKMSQKIDGSLVYEVEGEKQEKLFGLMPLKFKKTAIVSVETGELIETKESFVNKFLGLISF
ncbi:hypothetical protein HYU89_02790 [Candidatus Collierbacteria bacterium]|nr:hypothetical protein [Candidatus Collierbacteria bacterium]